jgi:DNA-binding GntR family transcriptional regulator
MTTQPDNDISKVGAVYAKLKDLVTTNQFKPHEQLHINKLSERLAVSLTPIREALIKLAKEELIASSPNRGYFAKPQDPHELAELCELAFMVMKYAIERDLSAFVIPEVWASLEANSKSPDRAGRQEGAALTCARVIEDIYEGIASTSNNAQLVKIIRNFVDRTHAVRVIDFEDSATRDMVVRDMQDLLRAVRSHDREAAVGNMRQQLEKKLNRLPSLVKESNARALGL